jgi:hypothetical protein
VFPTSADAFGLPLNEMRAGRAHFGCLLRKCDFAPFLTEDDYENVRGISKDTWTWRTAERSFAPVASRSN